MAGVTASHAWPFDWSGLRPLTELEYEKACRGPSLPVDNGFPWGTTAGLLINRLQDVNTTAESPQVRGATLVAGAFYGGVISSAPLRNGAMADAASDQFEAGASYYGVMDLAGNVCEKCVVSYNHAAALAFSGLHGDGELNADGTANVADWPYQTAVSYGNGSIISRGGGWYETVLNCTVAAGGKTLVIDVTDAFGAGESLVISGLAVTRDVPACSATGVGLQWRHAGTLFFRGGRGVISRCLRAG